MKDDEFTFSIEGKDYAIVERENESEKNKKKSFHAPSLGVGAGVAGVCIFAIFFLLGDMPESSEPLIEKQIVEEPIRPQQISMGTFIQNGSPVLGNADAPITLVEFGDYQCHFCNVFYHNTEHKILEDYVMTGKVNVIFKDYTIIGQDSVNAAHAAHCAQEQGKFWQYHNTLYDNWGGENNGWASNENLIRFGQQINLDMDDFIECNTEGEYAEVIARSNADAQALGITGTPTFYIISASNQQVQTISGAQPYEVFEKIFNSMLES